jgi:hypothetical protein
MLKLDKMENKRDFNFDVKTSADLNKMLTGLLMDLRRGAVDHETAKSITLVADKINKNNVNAIDYKRLTNHQRDLQFFEDNL